MDTAVRRSARLAHGGPGQGQGHGKLEALKKAAQGGGDAALILDANKESYVTLNGENHSHTPRSSQKRKRLGTSGVSRVLPTSAAPPREVARSGGKDLSNSNENSPIAVTSKLDLDLDLNNVITQNRFQNGEIPNPAFGNGLDESNDSFTNDSFLRALDKIEAEEAVAVNQPKVSVTAEKPPPVADAITENKNEPQPDSDPDVFPPTPPSKEDLARILARTPKRRRSSSRLSHSSAGSKKIRGQEDAPQLRNVEAEAESSSRLKSNLTPTRSSGSRRFSSGGGGGRPGGSGLLGAGGGGDREKDKTRNENQRKKPNKKKKKRFNKFNLLAFTNRKAAREMANSEKNELSRSDLSMLSDDAKLSLANWGLPPAILKNYQSKGIQNLFQWQLECLSSDGVLEGRNLLYSAPTSAGKTLVSEILMIKRVLELGRKAIMILPFVSVAREKVFTLQSIFGDANVRVEGFMGSLNPPGGFKAVDIAICTIEKANSLINRLLEEDTLHDVGTLVVDELHMIGDPHRGYLLELLLTKILYMTKIRNRPNDNSMNASSEDASLKASRRYNIQVVGMSATLPNLKDLAEWLNAELFVTDFRPVPLVQHLKIENQLFNKEMEPVRNVLTEDLVLRLDSDLDDVVYLTLETVLSGFSVLIFCNTKNKVESTARKIRGTIEMVGNDQSEYPEIRNRIRSVIDSKKIEALVTQLRQCQGGHDKDLVRSAAFAVGYHHAGLTYENRDLIESAFKKGVLRVIVATTTLSAGVNLPARRVIITGPTNFKGDKKMDQMTYHQMCGRAGRNGIDTEGESILICSSNQKEMGRELFLGNIPKVGSALLGSGGSLTSSLKRALLEAVASGVAKLTEDVRAYAKCSYLFYTLEKKDPDLESQQQLSLSQRNPNETIEDCLVYLQEKELIRIQKYERANQPDEYLPTQLGSACLAASFSPEEGLVVQAELAKARKAMKLESELHTIYQITPIYVSDQLYDMDWRHYLKIWDRLSDIEREVGALVGVIDGFLARASAHAPLDSCPEVPVCKRFYTALALSDLVEEKNLDEVAEKFYLNKGILQSLQGYASTFAGQVSAFCEKLNWVSLQKLVANFHERLEFGVQSELIELIKVPGMNGKRARVLFDNGIKSYLELAGKDYADVESIIHKSKAFENGDSGRGTRVANVKNIWSSGVLEKLSEPEAAKKIVDLAREYVRIELGQRGMELNFGTGNGSSRPRHRSIASESQSHSRNSTMMIMNMSSNESQSQRKSESEKSSPPDQPDTTSQSPHHPPQYQCQGQSGNEAAAVVIVEKNATAYLEDLFRDSEEIEPEAGPGNLQEDPGKCHGFDLETSQDFQLSQKSLKKLDAMEEDPIFEDSQDMFQDSFPELAQVDFSALYNNNKTKKEKENENDPVSSTTSTSSSTSTHFSFSIEKQIEIQQQKSQKVASCRHRIDSEVTEGHQHDQKHSTPILKNQRLTLNQSPVPHLHLQHRDPTCSKKGQGHQYESEDLFLADDKNLLAELDRNFSFEDSPKPPPPESLREKLSESDVAMMKALAEAEEAAKFSEELFPQSQYKPVAKKVSEELKQVPSLNQRFSIMEGLPRGEATLDDFNYDEEDFIATQGPPVNENDEDQDEYGDSTSEDFQNSQAMTSGSSVSSTSVASMEILESELVISKKKNKKITVKVTGNVDLIPDEYFREAGAGIVGVALNLVPSQKKKSETSFVRQGIGAMIIGGKRASTSNNNQGQDQQNHSMAFYNGSETAWVFKWPVDEGVGKLRISKKSSKKGVGELLEKIGSASKSCALVLFDLKDKLKRFLEECGHGLLEKFPASRRLWDPAVAQWMVDFQDENSNVSKNKLMEQHLSDDDRWLGQIQGVSHGSKVTTTKDWDREVVESFQVWKVMGKLKLRLRENKLLNHYTETEMPSMIPLLLMELNGFGFNSGDLSDLNKALQFQVAWLELRAYILAGKSFCLSSPQEVTKVLFQTLGLKRPPGTKGSGKLVLQKMFHEHDLPRVILEWRKVTNALLKFVEPFQNQKVRCEKTGRVHGHYNFFTVTGRVIMNDPSLQCIPRDFDLDSLLEMDDLEEIKRSLRIKFDSRVNALLQQLEDLDGGGLDKSRSILERFGMGSVSMRTVFVPCSKEFSILTVDYSQLELRILAHFSEDAKLLDALNRGTDVFVEIAATWKKMHKDMVTTAIRQDTKGLVYGIIYGMGAKALSESMEVDEREAARLHSEFLKTYPGISKFLEKTVQKCEELGYIETMMGRRRYLPNITSPMPQEKSKARRQAINSQIQGSAADLVKSAMGRIHEVFRKKFPSSCVPVDWKRSMSKVTDGEGFDFDAIPILNMHDELIFEVRKSCLRQVAKIVKTEMENCVKLRVKLPVVIKVGESWGSVETYQV